MDSGGKMGARLIGCALALAVMAFGAAPAAATHSEGVGPRETSSTAPESIFVFLPPYGAFDVRLRVNASAESPSSGVRGRFWTELEGALTVDLRGRVTCVNVDGNHATLSGVIERSSTRLPGGRLGHSCLRRRPWGGSQTTRPTACSASRSALHCTTARRSSPTECRSRAATSSHTTPLRNRRPSVGICASWTSAGTPR